MVKANPEARLVEANEEDFSEIARRGNPTRLEAGCPASKSICARRLPARSLALYSEKFLSSH